MSAATSRCEAQPVLVAPPMRGTAEIAFARSDGETRIQRLFQRAPLRVLRPIDGGLATPVAVLLTTSGGLVGGDRLDVEVEVGAEAAAVVTQQAAEKVYRSLGRDCGVAIRLTVGCGGWLEWLPQETILFDGARLARTTAAAVASGGRLLAGEILVFGRRASGERLTSGFVRDEWRVRRDGRLVWVDALRLGGAALAEHIAHPAGLAGAAAVGVIVYVADDAAARIDATRDLAFEVAGAAVRVAATVVGGVMIARFLGRDALALRDAFAGFWSNWRAHAGGRAPVLPRVWSV